MQVTIVKGLFEQIVAMAAESPIEICGLLFGDTYRIDAVEPCRNVAPDPSRTFEIDPGALIAAHRAGRTGGPRIVGSYHSHPVSGMAWPSPRDAAAAEPDGSLWLIATHDDPRGRGRADPRTVRSRRRHDVRCRLFQRRCFARRRS